MVVELIGPLYVASYVHCERKASDEREEFWLIPRRLVVWRIEWLDGEQIRRSLVDIRTGEILDDVWLDTDGRLRSYSAPKVPPASGSPDRLEATRIEAVETATGGSDGYVVENSGDDRALPGERKV